MAKGNNGICCSIEMEPKTLKVEQLNHAREVAADVVQKLQPFEAFAIFTEGLRPIEGAEETNDENNKKDELTSKFVDGNENCQIIEGPCQCSIVAAPPTADSLDVIREPLSAPF